MTLKTLSKSTPIGRKASLAAIIKKAEEMGCPDLVENERAELKAIVARDFAREDTALDRSMRRLGHLYGIPVTW